MPRMIWTASSSQRSRSPGELPNSMPSPTCSVSNQAPPMPSTARPPLMWSRVVAIFATTAGLRKVFAPTMSPTVARSVASAQAASVSQPSKIGPSWLPTIGYRWSQVQSESNPSLSARMPASRREAQSVYWPQQFAPSLTAPSVMADDLLDAHADYHALLAGVALRVGVVAHGEVLDVGKGLVDGRIQLDHGAAHRHPLHPLLEQEADARVGLQLAVLEPPDHGVHEDHVGLVGVELEPHHR